MNAFQKMIEDVFKIPEFIEYFYTEDNTAVVTVSYQMNTEEAYTQFGYDGGVSFYLTCKTADFEPAKGMKITFRDKTYKIDSFYADAFNLTYNIYLKSISSK